MKKYKEFFIDILIIWDDFFLSQTNRQSWPLTDTVGVSGMIQ